MTEVNEVEEMKMDDVQLARGNEYLHALVPYGPSKMLRELTRRILVFDKSKIPMTRNEAAHTAQLSLSTDLNYFANELWVWITIDKRTKKRQYNWMPGRRGVTRHANKQAEEMGIKWHSTEPELLTDNEKRLFSIPLDSLAVRIKVRDDVSMASYNETLKTMSKAIGDKEAYKELGPPPSSGGIGVVTKYEMTELDKTGRNKMPHFNRSVKRALTEAQKGKFNLQFGGGSIGAPADYSDYILGDTVDGDLEDITALVPTGYPTETFGEAKERMKPDFWKGICETMVKEELARDAFVAAELLAFSLFTPRELNEEWALKYFNHAKELLADDETLELKEIAPEAYRRLFETKEQTNDRLKKEAESEDEPEETKKSDKKPVSKKEVVGRKEVQKPEKTKTKKQATPKPKEKAPKKPEVDEKKLTKKPDVLLDDKGLTKNEIESYQAMAKDYPRYTPKHNQDWETAKKYINLKKVTTSWDEFREIVKQMKGDVRLGMCRMLGYL